MNEYTLSSNGALAQNSSGGKLLKWKIGTKFIKTSTYDETQLQPIFLYESYAEVIAYKIAKYLNLYATPYKLCKITIDNSVSTIACECDDFRLDGEQYYSFGKLMIENIIPILGYGNREDYARLIKETKSIPGMVNQIQGTLFLDSLILNDDRHYSNLGILQNKSGKCRPAPIFDNVNSLFCHKHTEGLKYSTRLMNYIRCKPFAYNFNTQLELIDKIEIDKKKLKTYVSNILRTLINNYELPKERAEFIRELLYNRIDYIVGR